MLKDGDTVSPIRKDEQDFLALMMDADHIVQYSEGFLIGDEVYITSGPLKRYRDGFEQWIDIGELPKWMFRFLDELLLLK